MRSLLSASVSLPGRLNPTALAVAAGERVAVIGPNGGGKTSLLRVLAGIDGDGAVTIAGVDLAAAAPAKRRRMLSLLPASRDIAWPIPVRDVLKLGMVTPDPRRIDELLEQLDLTSLAERPISSLSTGERTRALLGRALASRPQVLLLDEPLSNLDPAWALRILDLLDDAAAAGTAVVLALHDLALLPRFDRAIVVDEGEVVADDEPTALLASPTFGEVFGIDPIPGGWALRRPAGRRSSP